jgi:hypothetical protein
MYVSFRGDPAWTTNFIGIERASFANLRPKQTRSLKKRLLRLANNYDDMATTKTKRDQAAMRPELNSTVDSYGSN